MVKVLLFLGGFTILLVSCRQTAQMTRLTHLGHELASTDPPLHFRCSSSTSALSEKYLGFDVSGPAGAAAAFGNVFQPRSGQTTSLFNANARACAGPLIPKIQFNGSGGLPTYISLTRKADVFA